LQKTATDRACAAPDRLTTVIADEIRNRMKIGMIASPASISSDEISQEVATTPELIPCREKLGSGACRNPDELQQTIQAGGMPSMPKIGNGNRWRVGLSRQRKDPGQMAESPASRSHSQKSQMRGSQAGRAGKQTWKLRPGRRSDKHAPDQPFRAQQPGPSSEITG
jgi:hypothetical protein